MQLIWGWKQAIGLWSWVNNRLFLQLLRLSLLKDFIFNPLPPPQDCWHAGRRVGDGAPGEAGAPLKRWPWQPKQGQVSLKHVFKCCLCSLEATQQYILKRHKETVHEGIRYKWPSCFSEATYQTTLMWHIEAIREGIKYKCPHCDDIFS